MEEVPDERYAMKSGSSIPFPSQRRIFDVNAGLLPGQGQLPANPNSRRPGRACSRTDAGPGRGSPLAQRPHRQPWAGIRTTVPLRGYKQWLAIPFGRSGPGRQSKHRRWLNSPNTDQVQFVRWSQVVNGCPRAAPGRCCQKRTSGPSHSASSRGRALAIAASAPSQPSSALRPGCLRTRFRSDLHLA